MSTPLLTVCAWCDLVLNGDGAIFHKGMTCTKYDQEWYQATRATISHGICESCKETELKQWRESQRKVGENANTE